MTIGEVLEMLNDVPEGFTLDEWTSLPFMVEIGTQLIEVQPYQVDIDVMDKADEDDDNEVAFIVSPLLPPPLDEEEDGFFEYPSINLN